VFSIVRVGGPERLGVEGVLELGRLYRAVIADLALARRSFPGDPVLERLEPLALRARHAVYGERSRRGSLREFLARDYWRDVRAHRALLAVSLATMFAPTLLAAIWALSDPGAAIGLIPGAYRAAADPQVRHLPADYRRRRGSRARSTPTTSWSRSSPSRVGWRSASARWSCSPTTACCWARLPA